MSKKRRVRRFKGLSDFFWNATPEEKKAIYERVIEKSIARQNETLKMMNGSEITFVVFDEHGAAHPYESLLDNRSADKSGD